MPDKLDPGYCRREALRMRTKAVSEANAVLRAEYLLVAEHFELLAREIEDVQRHRDDDNAA